MELANMENEICSFLIAFFPKYSFDVISAVADMYRPLNNSDPNTWMQKCIDFFMDENNLVDSGFLQQGGMQFNDKDEDGVSFTPALLTRWDISDDDETVSTNESNWDSLLDLSINSSSLITNEKFSKTDLRISGHTSSTGSTAKDSATVPVPQRKLNVFENCREKGICNSAATGMVSTASSSIISAKGVELNTTKIVQEINNRKGVYGNSSRQQAKGQPDQHAYSKLEIETFLPELVSPKCKHNKSLMVSNSVPSHSKRNSQLLSQPGPSTIRYLGKRAVASPVLPSSTWLNKTSAQNSLVTGQPTVRDLSQPCVSSPKVSGYTSVIAQTSPSTSITSTASPSSLLHSSMSVSHRPIAIAPKPSVAGFTTTVTQTPPSANVTPAPTLYSLLKVNSSASCTSVSTVPKHSGFIGSANSSVKRLPSATVTSATSGVVLSDIDIQTPLTKAAVVGSVSDGQTSVSFPSDLGTAASKQIMQNSKENRLDNSKPAGTSSGDQSLIITLPNSDVESNVSNSSLGKNSDSISTLAVTEPAAATTIATHGNNANCAEVSSTYPSFIINIRQQLPARVKTVQTESRSDSDVLDHRGPAAVHDAASEHTNATSGMSDGKLQRNGITLTGQAGVSTDDLQIIEHGSDVVEINTEENVILVNDSQGEVEFIQEDPAKSLVLEDNIVHQPVDLPMNQFWDQPRSLQEGFHPEVGIQPQHDFQQSSNLHTPQANWPHYSLEFQAVLRPQMNIAPQYNSPFLTDLQNRNNLFQPQMNIAPQYNPPFQADIQRKNNPHFRATGQLQHNVRGGLQPRVHFQPQPNLQPQVGFQAQPNLQFQRSDQSTLDIQPNHQIPVDLQPQRGIHSQHNHELRPYPQPNSQPEHPGMDFAVKTVMEIFPGTNRQIIRELLNRFLPSNSLDQALDLTVNHLVENPVVPAEAASYVAEPEVTVLQEVKRTPPPKNYYKDYSTPVSSIASQQAAEQLSMEFRMLPLKAINEVHRKHGGHYAPSHRLLSRAIRKAMIEAEEQAGSSTFQSQFKFPFIVTLVYNEGETTEFKVQYHCLKHLRSLRTSKLTNLHPELQAEVDFVEKSIKEEKEEGDLRLAWALLEAEYETQGQSIECGCCCAEQPFENLVQCYEGHLVCRQCLLAYTREAVFGSGKLNLMCLTGGCDTTYPKAQLMKALPEDVLQKYDERVAEENISLAAMPDLVRCPHCNHAAVLDPTVKKFKCPASSCQKETCRDCKENWSDHVGKTCDQVEKKDETKLRKEYEEKMTAAKVRTCPNCKAQFFKEEGCNKMTCRCGTTMCYICRQVKINYQHFCQHPRDPGKGCTACQACFLWSNPEEDEARAIAEIQKEAQEKRKQQGFFGDKFIGAPDTNTPPLKKRKL